MKRQLVDNPFITEMKDKNGDSWYHQIVIDTIKENKDKEIERLHSIIKEAREYITTQKLHKLQDTTGGLTYQERKLLEILDKVEENK